MIVKVDSLIAYVNKNDKYHEVVSKFFEKVATIIKGAITTKSEGGCEKLMA